MPADPDFDTMREGMTLGLVVDLTVQFPGDVAACLAFPKRGTHVT